VLPYGNGIGDLDVNGRATLAGNLPTTDAVIEAITAFPRTAGGGMFYVSFASGGILLDGDYIALWTYPYVANPITNNSSVKSVRLMGFDGLAQAVKPTLQFALVIGQVGGGVVIQSIVDEIGYNQQFSFPDFQKRGLNIGPWWYSVANPTTPVVYGLFLKVPSQAVVTGLNQSIEICM
jgi:hypothetical protein